MGSCRGVAPPPAAECPRPLGPAGARVGWQMGEGFVQSALGFGEELEEFVWHGLL